MTTLLTAKFWSRAMCCSHSSRCDLPAPKSPPISTPESWPGVLRSRGVASGPRRGDPHHGCVRVAAPPVSNVIGQALFQRRVSAHAAFVVLNEFGPGEEADG